MFDIFEIKIKQEKEKKKRGKRIWLGNYDDEDANINRLTQRHKLSLVITMKGTNEMRVKERGRKN